MEQNGNGLKAVFDYEAVKKKAEKLDWSNPREDFRDGENYFGGFVDNAATIRAEEKLHELFEDKTYDADEICRQGKAYLETLEKSPMLGSSLDNYLA